MSDLKIKIIMCLVMKIFNARASNQQRRDRNSPERKYSYLPFSIEHYNGYQAAWTKGTRDVIKHNVYVVSLEKSEMMR